MSELTKSINAQQDDTLARIESKVDQLYHLIYEGNGQASLMTRIDRVESFIAGRRTLEGWIARAVVVGLVGVGFSGLAVLFTALKLTT